MAWINPAMVAQDKRGDAQRYKGCHRGANLSLKRHNPMVVTVAPDNQLSPPPQPERHALIIGAGIGGLTTAIALKQIGFTADVFDREPNQPPSPNPATV